MLKDPVVTEILAKANTDSASAWCPSSDEPNQNNLLAIGIAALQAFIQDNFLGPRLDACQYSELPLYAHLQAESAIDFAQLISVDGEDINVNATHPELILIAKSIFEHLLSSEEHGIDENIVRWWHLRYIYVHQQLLDEATNTLYTNFLSNSEKLLDWTEADTETKTLLRLEIVQGLLAYRRAWKAVAHLDTAKELLSATVEETAFLGKRTKWQQNALPQMALKITLAGENRAALLSAKDTHSSTHLPTLLKLDDDVRLEKITFQSDEDNRTMELATLVQQLVLSILLVKTRYLSYEDSNSNFAGNTP